MKSMSSKPITIHRTRSVLTGSSEPPPSSKRACTVARANALLRFGIQLLKGRIAKQPPLCAIHDARYILYLLDGMAMRHQSRLLRYHLHAFMRAQNIAYQNAATSMAA